MKVNLKKKKRNRHTPHDCSPVEGEMDIKVKCLL